MTSYIKATDAALAVVAAEQELGGHSFSQNQSRCINLYQSSGFVDVLSGVTGSAPVILALKHANISKLAFKLIAPPLVESFFLGSFTLSAHLRSYLLVQELMKDSSRAGRSIKRAYLKQLG